MTLRQWFATQREIWRLRRAQQLALERHLNDPPEVKDPLEYLVDLSKLELNPDDILVFRFKQLLDKDQVEAIRNRIDAQIGERLANMRVKTLIMTGDAELAVLRREVAAVYAQDKCFELHENSGVRPQHGDFAGMDKKQW